MIFTKITKESDILEDNKKYIIIGIIAVIIFAIFVAVILNDNNDQRKVENKTENTSNTSNTTSKTTEKEDNFDYETAAEEQMATAKTGETIAVMHVKNYGDITFKFFKDRAPKAVENFLTHAKDGYYDGLKFHRVMEEFMIQGGDPKGDGTGGESIWGEGFGTEIDKSLVPYRGALCMAMSNLPNSIGSQFFIVQANADETMTSRLLVNGYSENLVKQYSKYGGYLSLYEQYTVFGQVIDGMETVDKIAKSEKTMSDSGELSQPVEDIIIENIEVKEQE